MFILDDILGAIFGGNAAAAHEKAIKEAMDLNTRTYNEQQGYQKPYWGTGVRALGQLETLGSDPSSIANNPAYQFRLSEGQKALERSAAARGGLNSGGFMKGMARYSQGLASEEYGNQWNRLAQVAGMGQNSANSLGQLGSNYASNMSQLYADKGNAQAAGQQAIGGGISGAIGSIGRLATMGLGGGFGGMIPTQGMGGYGMANPATTMINPASMPRFG